MPPGMQRDGERCRFLAAPIGKHQDVMHFCHATS
ncbi:hypothetical protein CBM2615_A180012 [Cupriavidus taiwanensis]|nr:hypothetical protein CBM2615_A180012 [Cupriavidus taiwanensis]SPA04403.1 hypothetical protein CBM2625_A140012 [Cupriavidus taiwanensis]